MKTTCVFKFDLSVGQKNIGTSEDRKHRQVFAFNKDASDEHFDGFFGGQAAIDRQKQSGKFTKRTFTVADVQQMSTSNTDFPAHSRTRQGKAAHDLVPDLKQLSRSQRDATPNNRQSRTYAAMRPAQEDQTSTKSPKFERGKNFVKGIFKRSNKESASASNRSKSPSVATGAHLNQEVQRMRQELVEKELKNVN